MKFRNLRADEIECRVATIKEGKGLSLLLYKNARCDMNILDETVGVENWQRRHYECKGNLFCSVGINVNYEDESKEPLWIWKDDCGTESYAEKEKGESSDSFKRSCFCWSIGRELYTAPFIWIKASDCEIKNNKCTDKFYVSDIEISEDKVIKKLRIKCRGKVVFSQGYGGDIGEIEPEVFCPKCKKQMLKMTSPNGKVWTPQKIVEQYGMCEDCYKKQRLEILRKQADG